MYVPKWHTFEKAKFFANNHEIAELKRLGWISSINGNVVDGGTIVCTEGPRFETPAEIKMLSIIGGTIVGMTTLPEAVLAREKEICYAPIAVVSNYSTSISPTKLNTEEVYEIMAQKQGELIDLLFNTIKDLSKECDCDCHHVLDSAHM